MRKLVYWCCTHLKDSSAYNIRRKSRREAAATRIKWGSESYSQPFKVSVFYRNALSLLQQCLGEGGIREESPEEEV